MKKFIIIIMLITNCAGTEIIVTGNYYYKETTKTNYGIFGPKPKEYTIMGCKKDQSTEVQSKPIDSETAIILIVLSPLIISFAFLYPIIAPFFDGEDRPYIYLGDSVDRNLKTQLTSDDCAKKIKRVGE